MTINIHRDYDLKNELPYVILRLVQLRDRYLSTHSGEPIHSVGYRGCELGTFPELKDINLSNIDKDEASELCRRIGYVKKRNVYGKVVSKVDITVNNRNYSVRCH